jgi:hypothetical protein
MFLESLQSLIQMMPSIECKGRSERKFSQFLVASLDSGLINTGLSHFDQGDSEQVCDAGRRYRDFSTDDIRI